MYILYVCVSRYVKICQGHVAIASSTSQLEGWVAQERLDLGRGRRPSTIQVIQVFQVAICQDTLPPYIRIRFLRFS